MNRSLKMPFAMALGAALCVFGTLRANATLLTFDLNVNFETVNAGGDVIVAITEAATAGNVTITVTNNTEGFLNDLYLNYTPNGNLAGATVLNFDDTLGIVTQPTIHWNALQGFAIDFGYQTANGTGRFNPGEAVSFELDATAALTVLGFNNLGGTPKGDDYYAAAHISAIPATGICTAGGAKIGDANGGNVAGGGNVTSCDDDGGGGGGSVPEPNTVALAGLGLLSLAFLRRRQRV